jgi:hypothetical protein
MRPTPALAALLLLLASTLPGTSQTADPAPGSRVVTPQGFQLPAGGNCSAEIARYRAIQENDLAMGHVAQSVYDKIKAEIAAAERECSSGNDAKARGMIITSKRKHGYPTDL